MQNWLYNRRFRRDVYGSVREYTTFEGTYITAYYNWEYPYMDRLSMHIGNKLGIGKSYHPLFWQMPVPSHLGLILPPFWVNLLLRQEKRILNA